MIFTCPVCDESLARAGSTLRCGRGHAYDIAREGYVNLLSPAHRHAKDPGYNREMIAARRDFFAAGHYQPLADDLARLVLDHLPDDGAAPVVLDAGCGEGYYLRRLAAVAGDTALVRAGFDLSKHGIRIAARQDPAGAYAVAAIHHPPVTAGSVDVLLSHFSPVSGAAFARLVRPGGVVLVGGPGPRHLAGLKSLVYADPAEHAAADQLGGEPQFSAVGTHRVTHPLAVRGPGQVGLLLRMTPYYWSAGPETQVRLAALDALDTEIDVVVSAYRRV